MPLLKNGRAVLDTWRAVADDGSVPADGDVIVSLDRLLAEANALKARAGRLGVRLEPDADLEALAPHLNALDLVAIAFPRFADGRGYSLASLLRMRYEFSGEIRAIGDVLRDQLAFMVRCGIDAFETTTASADDLEAARGEISLAYQAASDWRRPVWRLRRDRAAARQAALRVAAE